MQAQCRCLPLTLRISFLLPCFHCFNVSEPGRPKCSSGLSISLRRIQTNHPLVLSPTPNLRGEWDSRTKRRRQAVFCSSYTTNKGREVIGEPGLEGGRHVSLCVAWNHDISNRGSSSTIGKVVGWTFEMRRPQAATAPSRQGAAELRGVGSERSRWERGDRLGNAASALGMVWWACLLRHPVLRQPQCAFATPGLRSKTATHRSPRAILVETKKLRLWGLRFAVG